MSLCFVFAALAFVSTASVRPTILVDASSKLILALGLSLKVPHGSLLEFLMKLLLHRLLKISVSHIRLEVLWKHLLLLELEIGLLRVVVWLLRHGRLL